MDGTQKESDELMKKFVGWGWTPTDVTAKEATKEALLKIHSPYILHLATHGFFAKEDPPKTSDRTGSVFERSAERYQIEVFQEPDASQRVSLGRRTNHD